MLKTQNSPFYWRWFVIFALVIVLDQLTKWFVVDHMTFGQSIHVDSYMNWHFLLNRGAAFGFLSHQSGWQKFLFVGLALTIFAVLGFLIYRRQITGGSVDACFLIMAGALSNSIDRIFYQGAVIDFIEWHFHHLFWPVFNIADCAITLGAFLLIFFNRLGKERVNH